MTFSACAVTIKLIKYFLFSLPRDCANSPGRFFLLSYIRLDKLAVFELIPRISFDPHAVNNFCFYGYRYVIAVIIVFLLR